MKPTFDNMLTAAAILVTASVVAISGYLLFANVGQRWAYGLAIGIMIVAWFARRLTAAHRDVTTSLVMAGVLLSIALGAKALEHLGWSSGGDMASRMNGILIGVILVVVSNAIPKRMTSANALTMLRTVGRAFVIGGFGYATAWLVLPLRFAGNVAMVIVLLSLVVAVGRYIVWHRSNGRYAS
jgi:hypothetical protein